MPSIREIKKLRLNRFSQSVAKELFQRRPNLFTYASAVEKIDGDGLSTFYLCITVPSEHPHWDAPLEISTCENQIIHFVWHPPGFTHACDWDEIGLMIGMSEDQTLTVAFVVERLLNLFDQLIREELVFCELLEDGCALVGPITNSQISEYAESNSAKEFKIRSWRGTYDQDNLP